LRHSGPVFSIKGSAAVTMKCSVYIATSVDGFIARTDGDIDWLDKPEYAALDGEDLGYDEFINSVDVLVMGSATFEKVLSFGEWPYGKTPVIVLSRRNLAIPSHLHGSVRVENLAPGEVVSQLEREGASHLYIDGGKTIQGFIQAGLIHEITITQIPILLGSGIPLFGPLGVERSLVHQATKSFSNGFVQTTYQVACST
jgi:dihydrofolate reductase